MTTPLPDPADRAPNELADQAAELGNKVTAGIVELASTAAVQGTASGISWAADYIETVISEVGIVGDALAILLIIRDQLRLSAIRITTEPPTKEPDAPST